MLIWGGILFAFVLILFLMKPKSVHIWLFVLDAAAILLLLLADILYVAKVGSYEWKFWLEYRVYRLVTKIPISIFEVKTVVNVAFWIFIVVSVLYQNQGIKYQETSVKRRKQLIAGAVLVISGITLFVFNSPQFYEKLYIMKYTDSEAEARKYQLLISTANLSLALYSTYTICYLFRTFLKTKIIFKKQQLCVLTLVRLFTTLLVFSICAFTPMNRIVNNFEIHDFSKQAKYVLLYHSYETLILVIVFLVLVIVAWFGLDILDDRVFRADYPDAKNVYVMLGDIRHIFHSYKNAMLSLKLLIGQAKEKNGTKEAELLLEDALQRLSELAERSAGVLDIYNQADLKYDCVSASDCMSAAQKRALLGKTVQLTVTLPDPEMGFYGDQELVVESLTNLLNNASEALEKKEGEKRIEMNCYVELPWLCISIRDNGIGIEKKYRKKIFEPAFSTKKTYRNWGMGLAFVRNVVKEHSGYINVKSRKGEYTEFQIVLPFERKKSLFGEE